MFNRRIMIASMAAFLAVTVMGARVTFAADADSPAGVMTAFFTAVEKGDYTAAKALLSAKGKEKTTDEKLKQLTEILKGGFTVGEAEVDGGGDSAKVKCSVPKRRKATSFYLVKEGGKWLYQGN